MYIFCDKCRLTNSSSFFFLFFFLMQSSFCPDNCLLRKRRSVPKRKSDTLHFLPPPRQANNKSLSQSFVAQPKKSTLSIFFSVLSILSLCNCYTQPSALIGTPTRIHLLSIVKFIFRLKENHRATVKTFCPNVRENLTTNQTFLPLS